MGSFNKKIPKTLKECTRGEHISDELYTWSDRLKTIGIFSLVILLSVGLLISIYQVENSLVGELMSDDGVLFIIAYAKWVVAGIIIFIICYVLSVFLGACASVVQNTRITADVALYLAQKQEENIEDDNAKLDESYKLCPDCNCKNKFDVKFCENCGKDLRLTVHMWPISKE